MTAENRIDYSGTIAAARKGDENSFEFLYNQTVQKYRAVCMKYFDPATERGRLVTDETLQEIYIRIYEGLKTLAEPSEFPVFGLSVAERVCRRRAAVLYTAETRPSGALQLEDEAYIEPQTSGYSSEVETAMANLASAHECRGEIKREPALAVSTIGELVLAVLHRLPPAQRLELLLWNADYGVGTIAREVHRPLETVLQDLTRSFARVEESLMRLEKEEDLDSTVYAKYRLSFFNWLLDRYNRFYEAESHNWSEAPEVDYALRLDPRKERKQTPPPAPKRHPGAEGNMFGKDAAPEVETALQSSLTEDSVLVDPRTIKFSIDELTEEYTTSPSEFHEVWNAIRKRFYLRNDPVAVGNRQKDARDVLKEIDEEFGDYLEDSTIGTIPEPSEDTMETTGTTEVVPEPEEPDAFDAPAEEDKPTGKTGFLSTFWGKFLVGLVLLIVVLAIVVATAGQHTSHAAVEALLCFTEKGTNLPCAFC